MMNYSENIRKSETKLEVLLKKIFDSEPVH